MQPTIHCNKKPDIEAVNVRVFLLMNCGLHFLFRGLIIPRKSPWIWKIFNPNFLAPLCLYLVQKYEKNAVQMTIGFLQLESTIPTKGCTFQN
jgi:hypothetical protein